MLYIKSGSTSDMQISENCQLVINHLAKKIILIPVHFYMKDVQIPSHLCEDDIYIIFTKTDLIANATAHFQTCSAVKLSHAQVHLISRKKHIRIETSDSFCI